MKLLFTICFYIVLSYKWHIITFFCISLHFSVLCIYSHIDILSIYINDTTLQLIFSYLKKCADYEVSDKALYPTFARTFPPATQITKSIISLLLKFNWKRFTLVVGSSHKQQTCAVKLLELAEENNITLNDREDYQEPHIPLTTGNPFPGIVDRTYIDTRRGYKLLLLKYNTKSIVLLYNVALTLCLRAQFLRYAKRRKIHKCA